MENTILSIVAVVLALVVGIAMIILYKRRVIDEDVIEGTESLMHGIKVPVDSAFGKILEYAKTAVLTVEQLVKTGVINRDDESRKQAAMDIVETAAQVDGIEYSGAEMEVASACIEAEVSKLPRNSNNTERSAKQ